MQLIKTTTDETRYLVAEHIAEIWTMQDDGRWHVFARLAIPAQGAARGLSGPGGRIISSHDSKDQADKTAAALVKQLDGTVLEPIR